MTRDEINTAYSGAIILENQEILKAFKLADWPMMKKEQRMRLHREIYKLAYPDQKKRVITTSDLKKILNGVD